MKKCSKLFKVISAASLVLSLFSLYLAIIILGPAGNFFVFSALTAVLGILGLIGALGSGNLSFGCLITAMVVSASFTLITLGYSIADGDVFVIALIYFGLYTAGAVLAYREKRKRKSDS